MSRRFVAEAADEQVVADLSALVPANPFATPAYFRSRRQTGWVGWVLGDTDEHGRLLFGCGAFIKARAWNRKLEIPSLPAIPADSPFWEDLLAFCRRRYVTKLELDTFGSPEGVQIPSFGTCTPRTRCEYVLDLDEDIDARIDRRHRAHLKKAARAGLVMRRTRDAEAVAVHREMIGLSMDRRRARGEDVPLVGSERGFTVLLESGAGDLYQALSGDTVLASGLVLRAPRGAYFHSRGTSPEGMAIGASHFLIREIMRDLLAAGVEMFNIGGAEEGSGLERFKKRFGGRLVRLPSATCFVGPAWVRETNEALELFRSDQKILLHLLVRRVSRLAVYAIDLDDLEPPDPAACLAIRDLEADDLRTMTVPIPGFRERQLERLARFGTSYAHGIYLDGQLAHVAWLLPPAAMARDVPSAFRPRAGQAEITGAETLPAYRGKGIYPDVIRCLLEHARDCGMRRVYMKSAFHNAASRSGIEKAGLRLRGSVLIVSLPKVGRHVVWRSFR